jgi:hypothetical protein
VNWQSVQAQEVDTAFREDISEYVAELQLHMTLQARNLIPTLTQATSSREKLLQESQATLEKLVSRQFL